MTGPRRIGPTLWLAALLAGAAAPGASAQGSWLTYVHMSTVNDVLALRDSVLLATSDAGLVLYHRPSGTWSSITREPGGLAGNSLKAITYDRSGNLFAAVTGKGVSRLDTDGSWSLLNPFDGIPSDTVLALRAQGDTVWIGTTRGLALWDGTQVAGSIPDLGTTSPFLNNNIHDIVIAGDTLFVASPEGIYAARLSLRPLAFNRINGTLGLTNQVVRDLASNGRTLLALVSGSGITASFRWEPSTSSWPTELPGIGNAGAVRRLRDDHGIIVATTLAGTHVRGANGGWTQSPGSPNTDNLDNSGLEPGADPDGELFASVAGTLRQEAPPALPAWSSFVPPGPVGNNARNILWVNGSVYVAYIGEGISRLRDGAWRNWPGGTTNCPGVDCDTTFANAAFPAGMLADPSGAKWIGMWGGPLTRFEDDVEPPPPGSYNNSFYPSGDDVVVHLHSCVHAAASDSTHLESESQAGRWMGLDSDIIGDPRGGDPLGLDVYDAAGNFVRTFGPSYPGLRNGLIRGLECDRTNQMWVGYSNSARAGLSTFLVADSLHHDIQLRDVAGTVGWNVFGIAIRGDSAWVLADDFLHRFRQSNQSLSASLAIAGPPSIDSMHPLAVAANGTVFVGTRGGLRVHRRGQLPEDFTPDNSPLADLDVRSVFTEPSGAVWIATARGINRFDPEFVPPPEPTLTSLRVKLYPNPAWLTGAGFQLRLSGEARAYVGEVFDLTGRIVHRFSLGGNDEVFWQGRDLDQRPVRAGLYFVRVRGGGAEATSRVVVIK